MIRRHFFPVSLPVMLLLALLRTGGLTAQESEPLPRAEDLTRWVGLTPSVAFESLGPPESLFSYRGRNAGEDNVVFYYPEHFYMFWFQDRVWQVRVDDRWNGSVDGVRMGMTAEQVIALWGRPINDRDPEPTWTLPDRGYPMRIRLYFNSEGRLVDLYVFRSDW